VRRDTHPNHARCRAVTGQHCRVGPGTTRTQTSGIGRGHSTKVLPMRTRVRPELAASEPTPARPAAFQSPPRAHTDTS
jgi:hypothetical protein